MGDCGGGARLVGLENVQLLVADRFESQADQELLPDPPNSHDADKRLDRRGQLGRFDATDPHRPTRFGAKHGNIKHDADPTDRNIGQGKFIIFSAQGQMDTAFQEGPTGAPTFSHDRLAL